MKAQHAARHLEMTEMEKGVFVRLAEFAVYISSYRKQKLRSAYLCTTSMRAALYLEVKRLSWTNSFAGGEC